MVLLANRKSEAGGGSRQGGRTKAAAMRVKSRQCAQDVEGGGKEKCGG